MKQIKIVIMAFAFVTMFASCTGSIKDTNVDTADSVKVATDSVKVDSTKVDTTTQK